MRAIVSVFALVTLLLACSSEADPGEACNVPGGGNDVCADGTVCAKPTDKSNALVCIPICRDDKDCPPDSECKGVSGTGVVKGCRYKD